MTSEHCKLLNGEYYDYKDKELLKLHKCAQKITYKYNKTFDNTKKYRLLSKLLGKVGQNVNIETPFKVYYGKHIYVSDNTYINSCCQFYDDNEIFIGKNCWIGPDVKIYTSLHPLNPVERLQKNANYAKKVFIGDNVWICGSVVILPGVKIGDNSTIGAGSVVTKDIPENVKAFGNPCRVISNIV